MTFEPKLFTTLKGYDIGQFKRDLLAGVIVGVVALPLAIAFAVASGVSPERGLYTAVIAGFLISALGGSRVQIGGPTGAFVVVVYGIVQKYGVDGLMIATMMAGVMLIIMGLARFGSAIKFIPQPVVIGFTSGIAVIIFSGEVKDLLGLTMGTVPAAFVEKWQAFGEHLNTANSNAIGIAVLAFAIMLLWPRINRRIPSPFVALIATTVLARMLHLDVETIGSRFGVISSSFPWPTLPHASLTMVHALVGPAFTIALLAAVESLLSAVVADGMIGGRHRSNVELIAQGFANIGSPLFGGIPATGAIARTATNIKNGGRTPVAGIIHALTLLLIILFFGKWAGYIPFATLAAILMIVAYHMSEWRAFLGEFTAPRSDLLVMLTTFTLTVLVDLSVAIQVGMVLAAFLFMKRMSDVAGVQALTGRSASTSDTTALRIGLDIPAGVEVFEISGPFFFGAAKTFLSQLEPVLGRPRVLILRMDAVPAMDSTGIHTLVEIVRRSRKENTLVLLCDVHAQPRAALERSHMLQEIGESSIHGSLRDAIEHARHFI